MTGVRRTWTILVVALAVCLGAGDGAAQQEQPMDPGVYHPKLVNKKPFQRWWWAYLQRAYPLGEVADGAQLRALQQIEQSKAALAATSQPVSGNTWVNIGPAPILGGQVGATPGSRPMSGRVATIAVHPTDSNHWLIGGAQGGIWRTRDAGTTWDPLTDAQASLAMGAIAFAPSNPNIIYAGTGEAVFSGDAYAGAGLLKSTDGGTTWQLLATATFAKATFSEIRVDPTNPDIVVAATASGLAGRGREFPPSIPPRGIFKSTDGGMTWSQKLSGEATDLQVDPSSFNNQYAGIGDPFGSAANGVYRSTDGGETWTLISGPWSTMAGGVGRVELAISPSLPDVVYVSIQDRFDTPAGAADGGLLGLFRTDNARAPTPTFTQIPTGATDDGSGVHGYCGWDIAFNDASDQCWYSHKIITDQTDANILYAGGVPLWKCTSCTAANATWTEVSKTASNPANGIHVDQHAMAWAGTRLIVGNDGGVWSTTDGGATWADHNTNLALTQFYDGSIHPTDPNFALAGSQDNGTEKWTGTSSWQLVLGGDGAANAISSSNPDIHWAVSVQNLGIRRTKNGGAFFTVADSGINKTNVPFIARFEKCPSNDDVFIAGTDNIWRSNNFFSGVSPNWSDNLSGDFSSGISGLAFAPLDGTCGTYAFGSRGGSLRLTPNGGISWVNIDASNAVPNRAVTDMAFDPTNSNALYVTLSGFDEGTPGASGHVFKTTNALAASPTWTNVSPPVNIPHNTIALDPFDPNIVYVGTDLGVWKSTNGGATWTHMGPETGMPNVAVFDLKINHTTNRLVAFTHGRGAFILIEAPALSVTPTGSVDFGTVAVGGSADRTFTVQNSGTGTLMGNASTSPPFSVVTGGSFSLGAGASQEVLVRFSPTQTGTFPGSINFTSNGGNLSRVVTGTGGNPAPVLISLSPSSAVQGGPGFTLTGTGSNFVAGSVVRWNGVNRTSTFVSSTQLQAAIPASDIATAGTAQVTVFTPSPGGGTSTALTFTITPVANAVLLTVSIRGSAAGIVTSNPSGINCPSACSLSTNLGTTVTLTAAPGPGARFKGWGGGCSGTATTCTLTMNAAQSVTATFSRIFTDATTADLLPVGTLVRAAHFTELLEAINTVRPGTNLSWPSPAPSVGNPVLAIHMNTLRQALGLPPVVPGAVIAAQHLNEIRSGVRALE